MRSTLQTAFAITALLSLAASRATADPVTIHGFFVADPEEPGFIVFDFSGIAAGRSFRALSGHGPNGGGVPAPPGLTFGCLHACLPGSIFDLSNATAGGLQPFGMGTLTLGSLTYEDVSLSGSVAIRSPGAMVPPPPIDPNDQDQEFPVISAPFTFTGSLTARDADGGLLFSADLVGGGLAQTQLVWRETQSLYRIDEAAAIGYGLSGASPTPEPASLVLVGSALSMCAAARRRRRTAS